MWHKFCQDVFTLRKKIEERFPNRKVNIITTNGVFDLLHRGHINTLEQAKELGDVLVVLVDTDERVKKNKGKNRPINDYIDRKYMLASLSVVDYVMDFSSINELICHLYEIKPKFHVKDSSYMNKKMIESKTVFLNEGKIVFVDSLNGYSTTEMIKQIRKGKR